MMWSWNKLHVIPLHKISILILTTPTFLVVNCSHETEKIEMAYEERMKGETEKLEVAFVIVIGKLESGRGKNKF